jgi:hypothetical protein
MLTLQLSVVTYIAICCRFTKKLKFGKGLFYVELNGNSLHVRHYNKERALNESKHS